MPEYSSGPQEAINRQVQSPFGGAIMPGTDLCVYAAQIEQSTGLFEGNRPLTRRHARQRVIPLEVDSDIAIGRKEATFHIIKQVVVAKKQCYAEAIT